MTSHPIVKQQAVILSMFKTRSFAIAERTHVVLVSLRMKYT